MAAESQDNSSNERSSTDVTKLLKSMTSLLTSLQKNVVTLGSNMAKILKTQKEDRKDFAEHVKILNELDNTLKKNTHETHISNSNFSRFEKQFFSHESEMMSLERQINLDNQREIMETMELFKNQLVEIQGSMNRIDAERLEYVDSIARKFQAEENAKVGAEKEQNRFTQGKPRRERRGDGVSTSTRSKRPSTNDKNLRPTKRGEGRSGGDRGGRSSGGGHGERPCSDRGGRSSGSDRGGRSDGAARGGRALPPFCNLLTGQEITGEGMSYEGTRFPIDLRVKREEQ
ncbi:keratin, type II cytoskeletal 1-like [Impatiens glandulifera]|uniref:keratin, type II cytoskeletal 1-like n=1 Tax=Impatiens glandulifera TaxID=253017 RepID=UPI001FB1762E|nr:keratin, type II cytoskeletal 1-like [Impatiens glandulifera]